MVGFVSNLVQRNWKEEMNETQGSHIPYLPALALQKFFYKERPNIKLPTGAVANSQRGGGGDTEVPSRVPVPSEGLFPPQIKDVNISRSPIAFGSKLANLAKVGEFWGELPTKFT
jgi:hypothetical protein